ncbi:MAG: class I SAM-dependent methyltransferase [Gammaproteobacteria bacterium]|nr:class I SAM-dependent methyltransferase [Gammaproteobacteria bacterium]
MNVAAGNAQAAPPQYDAIAGPYQRSRQSPIRRYVEGYTFFGLVGEVTGLAVLDLACGAGTYSRAFAGRGARRVVGVDISPAMIALAQAEPPVAGCAIEYRVGDAADLPPLGPFDIAAAAYLLHYASDVAGLRRLCAGIARELVPGARLVAINENPAQPEERYAGYLQYGFAKSVASPRREGSTITYAMVSGRELFRFEVRHFERSTYEAALAAAGFVDVCWHRLRLDPAGVTAHGAAYWEEYLGNPPVVGLTARRAP